VTTEPREQHEPSMEEILSSIRRIIADEESEDSTDTDDLGAAEARAEALDDDVDAMADAADDDDSDDVLELTKMVREGGEVVDLRADEPPETADDDLDSADEPVPAAVAGEEPTPATPFATADDDDETEPGPTAETEFAPTAGDDAMTKESKDVESIPATAQLVSSTAATVATGAFAKLTQAIQRTPEEDSVADGSGRSVEQFVEDMARPMLKDWLDEHLPQIVERLVEKEIQKIARRAELM
jgi:cell pole-organizing protein PopZ